MKGVDLSNYALEDLLAFDDIFLDYFNNFLRNPTFAQPVQYNRYLSIFEEIDSPAISIVQTDRLPKFIPIRAQQINNKNSDDPLSLSRQYDAFTSSTHLIEPTPPPDNDDHINLNDIEQNKVFDWVRTERLPLFFRTDFFRDFKLCKLLCKSLNDDYRPDSATSSQLIGGYSRQSPPVSTSLSTEDPESRSNKDNNSNVLFNSTANLNDMIDQNQTNFFELLGMMQNQTQAGSNQSDLQLLERFNRMLFQRPGSRAMSVPAFFPIASMDQYSTSNIVSQKPKTLKSAKSANKDESEFDMLSSHDYAELKERKKPIKSGSQNGRKTIGFSIKKESEAEFNELNVRVGNEEGEGVDDEEVYEQVEDEEDYKSNLNIKIADDENVSVDLEQAAPGGFDENSKLHASINQYKMKFLGSVHGMAEFKEFLKPTSGYRLLKFWLDCEFYRDSMQDYDDVENMATRNRLFRDINEKHIFAFASKMHDKISKNYLTSDGQHRLNHALFDHIQYDVLRRLRAYWVPRYILSKLKEKGKNYGSFPLPPLTPDFGRQSTYMSAPSSSKTISMQQQQNVIKDLEALTDDQKRTLLSKVKQALMIDKDAGGPFLRYISANYPDKLPLILYWYDVCDFNNNEMTGGYDRSSRIQHAWAIYNSYLSPTARFNIGIPINLPDSLKYQNVGDLDPGMFKAVMEQIVPYLSSTWLQYVKDDVSKFTHAKLDLLRKEILEELGEEDDPAEGKLLPEPDLVIQSEQLFARRPWVQEYLFKRNKGSDKLGHAKKELTEEEKIARDLRRKKMEIERKRALKAALRRAKLNKQLGALEEEEDNKTDETGDREKRPKRGVNFERDRAALFNRMFQNKTMVLLFRKYLVDIGQREWLNKFNAYLEARAYLDQMDQLKRAAIGTQFMKAYLDEKSKRNINQYLTEGLMQKLTADLEVDARGGNNRPRTPFMSTFVKEFRNEMESYYQKFCEQQATENSMTAESFAMLNPTELLVLLGDGYNPKDYDFDEDKGEGKMLPSKDDKNEFLKILYDWSIGRFSDKFFSFYAHLSEHGKKDGMPFLEKDLMFCVDSVRMKEISGDEVLKQKARTLIDVYLDSSVPPAVQIDIPNDLHQKLYKSSQKILQGTYHQNDLNIFDDSKSHFFKELAPYWTGYKFRIKEAGGALSFMTKQDRMLRERLDEFITMKSTSPNDFRLPQLSARSKSATPTLKPADKPEAKKQHIAHHHPPAEPVSLNIVFSLATGIKIKDDKAVSTAATNQAPPAGNQTNNERRNSRVSRNSGSFLISAK